MSRIFTFDKEMQGIPEQAAPLLLFTGEYHCSTLKRLLAADSSLHILLQIAWLFDKEVLSIEFLNQHYLMVVAEVPDRGRPRFTVPSGIEFGN
jgi:hypothetical protein